MCSARENEEDRNPQVREKLERPQRANPHLIAVPVSLNPRVDSTSELAIYAVSGTGKQPS